MFLSLCLVRFCGTLISLFHSLFLLFGDLLSVSVPHSLPLSLCLFLFLMVPLSLSPSLSLSLCLSLTLCYSTLSLWNTSLPPPSLPLSYSMLLYSLSALHSLFRTLLSPPPILPLSLSLLNSSLSFSLSASFYKSMELFFFSLCISLSLWNSPLSLSAAFYFFVQLFSISLSVQFLFLFRTSLPLLASLSLSMEVRSLSQ